MLSGFSNARRPEQKKYWKVDPEIREDIIKLERYSKEIELFGRNHIETSEELEAFKERLTQQIEGCSSEKAEVNKQLRRKISPESADELKKNRAELTQKIKKLRGDLSLVQDVQTHEKKR